MSARFTYCDECDWPVTSSVKGDPRAMLCSRHPRVAGAGFVSPGAHTNAPPFLYCRDVNGGACPLFVPRRVAEVTS